LECESWQASLLKFELLRRARRLLDRLAYAVKNTAVPKVEADAVFIGIINPLDILGTEREDLFQPYDLFAASLPEGAFLLHAVNRAPHQLDNV
jgi:hypothetical protein